ncbi:alpha-ketoacid dehydrogenase subunit beta [Zavarzinia compransoris]|uniref:Alpha-ketoacid dehydrogenase subunit beta n=1 Tax=Zavarzinia compransoris TaxID=1264899 RepID=A0A317E605_9PROT|nr:alpha-ketoacid dehydrogenase subunit beta [Zavarzinia compransoris]PWR21640.1 alpha-ketoacid dehydrogenase subunit beta [Zavarzinia compransoris]TDP45579.1 pyruvate dehydrogenase E1 component beta subunit [Zavarzinia compransoris]
MARLKYYQALTRALQEEMARDERVILMGEDVGASGGIFAQTRGLHAAFGPDRVRDTPIAENGFVSAAVGAAMTGLRPVVEVGFEDFLTCCAEPLVNQAAKLRYMLGGQVGIPLLLYTFGGGGVNAGPQHSQNLAAWFAHIPGLKVVMPSTPADVLGLVKAGIRDDNPVICLLSKKLIGSSGPVAEAGEDFLLPIGQADVKRRGRDLTIVAFGQMALHALTAAESLAARGIEAEVIDPRSASPLDTAAIIASVRRTGHLCVVHEGYGPCGLGAEVVTVVVEQAMDALRKPPRRLTAPFAPSPFTPVLETIYMPGAARIEAAAIDLLAA